MNHPSPSSVVSPPASLTPPSRWRQIWLVVRVVLVVVLIGLILNSFHLSELREVFGWVRFDLLLLLLASPFVVLYLSTLRWLTVLKIQGVHLSVRMAYSYYLVATFFQLVMPGAYTSDLMRIYDIHRSTQKTAIGAASVLLERVSGFIVLSCMGTAAAFLTPALDAYPAVRLLSLGLFLASSVAFGLMLQPRLYRLLKWPFLPPRLLRMINSLETAFTDYRHYPQVLVRVFLYSALIQMVVMVAFYLQLEVLQVHIAPLSIIAIAPIILSITILPITPSSLGMQEGVYIVLMSSVGIARPDALAASLLARVAGLTVGLVGGLYYAFFRKS